MNYRIIAIIMIAVCTVMQCVREPVVADGEPHIPGKAVPVTAADFDARIAPSKVALIEFFSDKCQVCASLTWAIDSLYTAFGDSAFVGANNTDEDTLFKKFSISSVPTYVFFKNGQETVRHSFINNDSSVYTTLATLLQEHIDGKQITDTIDTVAPIDTQSPGYLTLNELTFDSTVLHRGITAMVFFLYAGGVPCIHMDAVISQFAPQFEGRAIIVKVHAWENVTLCDRYGISSVPQYLFFKDGVYKSELRRTGIIPGDTLVAVLNRLIADTLRGSVALLDQNNFTDSVNIAGRVSMVDFFLPTCGACTIMTDTVSALADTFNGKALIAKVDCSTDDTLDAAFSINNVPTFVFLKDGVEYFRHTGSWPFDSLAAYVRHGLEM